MIPILIYDYLVYFLYNFNLILRQPIEFIDELVDLAVGGVDLAVKAGFLL